MLEAMSLIAIVICYIITGAWIAIDNENIPIYGRIALGVLWLPFVMLAIAHLISATIAKEIKKGRN